MDKVKTCVIRYHHDGHIFQSHEEVKKKLESEMDISIKTRELLRILNEEMNARYKRIKSVSWQGNSIKNLLLRQAFAQAFMKIDFKKKIIINVDETWLGMSDFRRMRWTFPGEENSVAKKQIAPRISMIAALDSKGKVHTALMQSNSN